MAQLVATISEIQLVLASEVESVLHTVQRLDPLGYAARNVSECLRAQLEERADIAHRMHPENTNDIPQQAIQTALNIVDFHMPLLGRMDLAGIATALAISETEVGQAVRLIRSLSPKPAADESLATAMIPDVSVTGHEQNWTVRVNNSVLPDLRINAEYEQVVSQDSSAKQLRDQLQDARWLLRSVEMRNDTLLRATRFIFEHQSDFLRVGEVGLRPLTLKFVADGIGVHESTISRITTSKYVQTPHGVFSLKTFFPSQLIAADGVIASGSAVKATIQKLVARETFDSPLRDVDLAAILARRGIKIARRTIAKYREALGIGSSRERQEQYRLNRLIQRRVLSPQTKLAS